MLQTSTAWHLVPGSLQLISATSCSKAAKTVSLRRYMAQRSRMISLDHENTTENTEKLRRATFKQTPNAAVLCLFSTPPPFLSSLLPLACSASLPSSSAPSLSSSCWRAHVHGVQPNACQGFGWPAQATESTTMPPRETSLVLTHTTNRRPHHRLCSVPLPPPLLF